jgi:KaiC/GvpD/RAD55 family RecA-like ATPase
MFKKVLLIIAALIFAFGVLFTSMMRTSAQSLAQSYQVEPISATATDEAATGEAEGTPAAEEVEYQFPYPGILPDHFLYPLKMIRDRIWLFLTTDSLKRAELLLVYADKRLWAAQMLLDKGKEDLAVTTATKAEKYLEQAANQGEAAKKAGKEAEAFLGKLSQASLKHEEVLLGIRERVSDEAKEVIEKALDYPRRTFEQVKRILGKKEIKTTLVLEFSEDEIDTYSLLQAEPATAFTLLEKIAQEEGIELVTKKYDFGILVESIGGEENTKERAWIYFVNGKAGEVASDQYELSDGDVVEWRYVEPIY